MDDYPTCYRCGSGDRVSDVYREGGRPIDDDPAEAVGEEFTHDEDALVGPMCHACWVEVGTLIR